MANTFMTPREAAQRFLDCADEVVAGIPIEQLHKLVAIDAVRPGINGAIIASMVAAAHKRLVKT